MFGKKFSYRDLAAYILGCSPEAILGLAVRDNGDCSVIAPDGRKLLYTAEQIENAEKAVNALVMVRLAKKIADRKLEKSVEAAIATSPPVPSTSPPVPSTSPPGPSPGSKKTPGEGKKKGKAKR